MNFLGNSIWQLVTQSDKVTWIVLLILLALSIICWSLLFYQIIIFRSKKKQVNNAIANLKQVHNYENLFFVASRFVNTVPGFYLTKNLNYLKTLSEDNKTKNILTDREWEFLQYNSENSIDNIIHQEERLLPIFSVVAAISPLLGLFGTVWGLIHAFIDISKKQSADIITVAPGIAEALITTLIGIMVAIPALCMYYYLKTQSETIEQSLFLLADKFLVVVQKNFGKSVVEINKCVYAEEKKEHSLQK